MPDPSLIHGRAIPAPELADGVVTVRVVREAIGNNVPGQQVQVIIGGTKRIGHDRRAGPRRVQQPASRRRGARRGDRGRRGARVAAVQGAEHRRAARDSGRGHRQGRGTRRSRKRPRLPPARRSRASSCSAANTRVLMQFRDDALEVYYVLEILNTARARVDIGGPLTLDFPRAPSGRRRSRGRRHRRRSRRDESSSPVHSPRAPRWCKWRSGCRTTRPS